MNDNSRGWDGSDNHLPWGRGVGLRERGHGGRRGAKGGQEYDPTSDSYPSFDPWDKIWVCCFASASRIGSMKGECAE